MNYIHEINSFYEWIEANRLSRCAMALWHTLMNINNRVMWIREFEVAILVLQYKTGYARSEIYQARQLLTEKGRIRWRSRGANASAVYEIIPFGDKCYPTPASYSSPDLFSAVKDSAHASADGSGAVVDSTAATNAATTAATTDATTDAPTDAPTDAKGADARTTNKQYKTKKNKQDSFSEKKMEEKKLTPKEIFELYKQICVRLAPAKNLNRSRTDAIRYRINEYGSEAVVNMLNMAAKSNHLAGCNNINWKAGIDWLFKPANFVKVLDGYYSSSSENGQAGNGLPGNGHAGNGLPGNGSPGNGKTRNSDKPSPIEVLNQCFNMIKNNEEESC